MTRSDLLIAAVFALAILGAVCAGIAKERHEYRHPVQGELP